MSQFYLATNKGCSQYSALIDHLIVSYVWSTTQHNNEEQHNRKLQIIIFVIVNRVETIYFTVNWHIVLSEEVNQVVLVRQKYCLDNSEKPTLWLQRCACLKALISQSESAEVSECSFSQQSIESIFGSIEGSFVFSNTLPRHHEIMAIQKTTQRCSQGRVWVGICPTIKIASCPNITNSYAQLANIPSLFHVPED